MQRQRGRTENGKGGMNGIALLLLMLALTVVKSGCVGIAGSRSSGGNPPAVTISNPAASNISSTGATITWSTNVPADSQVDYGITLSYGQSSALNPAMVTSHSVVLSGLTPSTVYHYRVKSKDAAGNQATSGDFTFTTASGGTPPVISGVTATNISTTGATVSWITDKPADSQVDYGTTTSYGSSTTLDPTLVTSHSQGLSGLTPGTLYHYQVKSKDGAGNQATSGDFTFTTLPDNTPPVISGINASPSSTTALIFWTTDKPADSQVDYGTTASYGQSSALDSTQVTSHMVNLSGLTATTLYHYRVKSKASNGLLATSGDNTFTTAQLGGIPPGLGWFQIPNTQLASVCPSPSPGGVEGCSAVIADWSGGIADAARNRLIVWGGGHAGYFGNEVYALDLNNLTFVRLNDPSPTTNVSSCPAAYVDNTPSSRHTYDGIAYIGNRDRMFAYGGALASCGGLGTDTWTLDMANIRPGTNPWRRMDPHNGATPGSPQPNPNYGWPGVMSDYDANTGLVFLHDGQSGFFSYNYDTNTYRILNDVGSGGPAIDYHLNGVIDPDRKLFVMFGNGAVWRVDISGRDSTYTPQRISPLGCNPIVSALSPGLAYDTVQKKIVGWAGGSAVYVYDPDTNSCTQVTFPGGPGSQQPNGTFGRFRYFPSLGVFALVNDWQQNAFTLRLTP